MKRKGWRFDSKRHSLAAKGIRTRRISNQYLFNGLDLERNRLARIRSGYPPDPLINPTLKFKNATIQAMKEFKRSRPYHGSNEEIQSKYLALFTQLKRIYGSSTRIELRHSSGSSGGSYFSPLENKIVLSGRPSVVTFLHEFTHARGGGEYEATAWSVNLFIRIFPESIEKLGVYRHMLQLGNPNSLSSKIPPEYPVYKQGRKITYATYQASRSHSQV